MLAAEMQMTISLMRFFSVANRAKATGDAGAVREGGST
jgi:hypothetical protein